MFTIEELAQQISNLEAIVTNNTAVISNLGTSVATNAAQIVLNAANIQNNTNQNINLEEDDGSGTGSLAIGGLVSSVVVGVAVVGVTLMVLGTGRKSEKEKAVDNEKIDTDDLRDKSVYYENGSPRKLNIKKHTTKSNISHKLQLIEDMNNEHSPEAANILAHGAADSWNAPTAWQGKAGFIKALGEAGAQLNSNNNTPQAAPPVQQTQAKHVTLDLSQGGKAQNGQAMTVDKEDGSKDSWETDPFFRSDGNFGSFRSSPKHADTPKAAATINPNGSKPVTAFPDYVKTFTPTNVQATPDNIMVHHPPANTYVTHGYTAPTSTPTSGVTSSVSFDPNKRVPYPVVPDSYEQPNIMPMSGDGVNYAYYDGNYH